jgi:hypothetical protein
MVFARQKAAQCWCHKTTEQVEMDVGLAESFAAILIHEMYEPHLGCATTEELMNELRARIEMDGALTYSTVRPLRRFPHAEQSA